MGLRLLLLVCLSAFFCSCHSDNKKAASIDPRPNEVSFSREDADILDKSASIRTFVLSDSSEFFYDRNDLLFVYGKTKENRLFMGRLLWFRNYFKENMDTEISFSQFLNNLLTNPQDEAFIAEIVDKYGIFNQDPEVLKYVEQPISEAIERFTSRIPGSVIFRLKDEFLSPLDTKYSIAYLFYLKGFSLDEDDYEPNSFFVPLNKNN
ncbi:hypothetical protein [Sphingobacterium sp. 40-24]|uniref:hypothetical protein n=1 Tax=Sphingobacterium sp. 40-24 TaxID=1895843 RepID=UPI000961FA07|nr:hypothetical protein [Sphingobacterium sp. 40-24]OJZ06255.1 MAG: hypothetical protein BGP15_11040 [Sphingobacterium sp. 40-24]